MRDSLPSTTTWIAWGMAWLALVYSCMVGSPRGATIALVALAVLVVSGDRRRKGDPSGNLKAPGKRARLRAASGIVLLAGVATILLSRMDSRSQGSGGEDCRRERLSPRLSLSWPASGAWFTTPTGAALLVTDTARASERLVAITTKGRVSAAQAAGLEERHFPTVIRGSGRSIFIESAPSYTPPPSLKVLVFDLGLEPQGELWPINGMDLEGGGTLIDLFDWVPWKDGILAFARALRGDQPNLALAHLTRQGMGKVYEWLPEEDLGRRRDHFVHNRGYLAALPEEGFFLDLAGGPDLKKIDPAGALAGTLSPLPVTFRRPAFEDSSEWAHEWDNRRKPGADRRRAFFYYELLERTATATGLVATDERLYAVAKGVCSSNGKTPWWLLELASATGEEVRRIRLPSDAAHLTVVPPNPEIPGSSWALLERMGVGRRRDGAPTFTSDSIVFVPPTLISAPPSHWIDAGRAPSCAESLSPAPAPS